MDYNDLIYTREDVMKIKSKMKSLEDKYNELRNELNNITTYCGHPIGVKLHNWDYEGKGNQIFCLRCDKKLEGTHIELENTFNSNKIIHFEEMGNEKEVISDLDCCQIAFEIFVELKQNNPDFDDDRIIELINVELKNNTNRVKDKVLKKFMESI